MNCNMIPDWLQKALSLSDGYIRVLKKELEGRYMQYGVFPENLFWTDPDDGGYLTVPVKQISDMENELQREISNKRLLDECVERNNQGIALEKDGDIEAAVALYEENIKPGCYPAMHSFDRLLVIYSRTKD